MMRTIATGVVLCLFSDVALASWYQVEMIVFEHQVIDGGGELLRRTAPFNYHNAVPLTADPDGPRAFRKLPASRYKLSGVSKFLMQSGSYRLLDHLAWQQPELVGKKARQVHIADDPPARFEGSVHLRGGHLLHLGMDIVYFLQPLTQHNGESGFEPRPYAHMREVRRIKLNELHYFDHPLFGVIMRVTRLDPLDPE